MTVVKYAEIQTVRVICDAAFKNQMIEKIMDLGATGYTWWDCHGKGRREILPNPYSGADRTYIEIWCSIEVADKIVEHCNSPKYHNQGVTAGKEPLLVHGKEANKFTKG